MIRAKFLYDKNRLAVGFIVKCHGHPIVCSAVSMLVLNTVNSIEELTLLTNKDFYAKWDTKGGYMAFWLKNTQLRNSGAGLLLDALVLGLSHISKQYPKEIKLSSKLVTYKESSEKS